jgi:4-hydroxy-2-oxoheptanedioate aldolase
VKAAKFAPQGDRGVCRFVRAASYSSTDRYQYFKMANKSVMVIIHIEGTEEIANLGKILTVKGLDVISLGPYDLSQLRAFPEQIDYP